MNSHTHKQPRRIPREEMPFSYAALAREAFAVRVAVLEDNTSDFVQALQELKTKEAFLSALAEKRIDYVFDDVVFPHELHRWRVCVNKAYRVWSGLQRLERLNRQDKNAALFNGQPA